MIAKIVLFIVFLLNFTIDNNAQTLPSSRAVDWTLAGLRDTSTLGFQLINMQIAGAVADGITPNDVVVANTIGAITSNGAILEFSTGIFLFNSTINLPSNIIIKGQGADSTTFKMDLGGSGHSIKIVGSSSIGDTTSLTQSAAKDSTFINVIDTTGFSVGDWIQIIQIDTDLVTSTWAYNTVGQIVKINNIINNKFILDSPLRMDFNLNRNPYIKKIIPVKNVGLECIKIHRLDSTSPQQSSNVFYQYAVNSWVSGIESENCSYSHIEGRNSSNLYINKSYFHHAFGYGGDGRAYGVMLHSTTNECLVEDNVMEHLRHSMIVQSGANGNVFSYNYSLDPFWDSSPSNSAGDMVLHGNYPYSNLFEQNICRNIVIDNSHGPNGPHNTFFRNRAEGFGIFFSANNSPNQNFIGNDIPNTTFPYNVVNYNISGMGHFLYGNNNKGTIDPSGTSNLPDLSYAYLNQPSFISTNQWVGIGTPNVMGANNIPVFDRYISNFIFSTSCNNTNTQVDEYFEFKPIIYPNPTNDFLTVLSEKVMQTIIVMNTSGQILYSKKIGGKNHKIDARLWSKGLYFVKVFYNHEVPETFKVMKVD
jgi:hypothetical protein